jgi:hypothetical protein
VRRLVQIVLALLWIDQSGSVYAKYMWTPFAWLGAYLIEPIGKVRPLELLLLIALVVSIAQGAFKVRTVRPMRRTLLGAGAVTLFALVYGLARGGDARSAGWQVYQPFATVLGAFAVAATHHKAEHFVGLYKAYVAAGVIHAVSTIIFHYSFIAPGLVHPLPEAEARHDDTVLWVSCTGILVLLAVQYPSARNRVIAGVLVPILLAAIQFNNRRLAWISLVGAMVALYFVLPDSVAKGSVAKRRIRRVGMVMIPVATLYVAIGWGQPEGIFSPLRAFQTVSTDQDKSTKARNMENLGLIATANQHGWVFGSGWGQKYVEVCNAYQIYGFELWPYVPHNSILGLLAYTGYVGFVGFWMIFPMAAFFHARVARNASRPLDRYVAAVSIMQLVACVDQWYGDMGSFTFLTVYTLVPSLGVALRVPIAAGVWSNSAKRLPPAAPAKGV